MLGCCGVERGWVQGWLRRLLPAGCGPRADTAELAASGLEVRGDTSHANWDPKAVVSVAVVLKLKAGGGLLKSRIQRGCFGERRWQWEFWWLRIPLAVCWTDRSCVRADPPWGKCRDTAKWACFS